MTAPDPRLNRRLAVALLAALALGLALLVPRTIDGGGGEFVYWIEDAYIHLALARNLVEHGVFGVTPHGFTAASSSPGWTLALAGLMAVVGATPLAALFLNIAAGVALALVLAHAFASTGSARWGIAGAAAALGTIAPLPLILSGMEHVLHCAVFVAAALLAARQASDERTADRTRLLAALLLFLPLLRLESLWLHVLLAAFALLRGDRRLAALAIATGALPVVLQGAVNLAQGWPFLPAPILAKTVYLSEANDGWLVWSLKYFLWWPVKRVATYVPELLILMVAADAWLAWTLWRDPRAWRRRVWVLVFLFLAGAWTHATFAAFGWGGRYESYLLALGWVALAGAGAAIDWPALLAHRGRRAAVAGLAVLLVIAGSVRVWNQHRDQAGAVETVALRDVWPGRFIATLCRESPCEVRAMAMNIGALSWHAGPRLTDLLALGDREVLDLLGRRRLDSAAVARLAADREIEVALIFEDWYATWIGGTPPLVKVATLRQRTDWPTPLTLYARDEAGARRLAGALRRQEATLPQRLDIDWAPGYQ
ncbi:MAG: hypothetical protein FJX02_05080 [Alphaproteobacteria bacterium]|nr:hypothetical protein [Alphaproteobacteria bacterium]